MHFEPHSLYHIYNKTNNGRLLFTTDSDYLKFLEKINTHIKPFCDILLWCLMPNHFHFLIHANEQSIIEKKVGGNTLQQLTSGFKITLSSYSNSLNKKDGKSGNLFQQKTKAKVIEGKEYPLTVFHYIHQNAYKAKLVSKIEGWPYSSFPDFAGFRNGRLCNKQLSINLLEINMEMFYEDSYKIIDDDLMIDK
jgi:putative transposase